MTQIDAAISEKYGITYFGMNGFEIQRGGRLVKVFNYHRDPHSNYEDALAWAKTNDYQPAPDEHLEAQYEGEG